MSTTNRQLTSLDPVVGAQTEVFIGCASFEDRCLGTVSLLSPRYRLAHSYLCVYDDFSEVRQTNVRAMTETLQRHGPLSIVEASEQNPSRSIAELMTEVRSIASKSYVRVTLDVSTFTKRHLLMLLHDLDDAGLWDSLRILYTEPKDYVVDMYVPMSTGI